MNLKEFRESEGHKYLPAMAVIFVLFVLCVLFFFLVFRFSAVRRGVSAVIRILMPFFYGAAFAYLLRPLCKYFHRNFKCRLARRVKEEKRADAAANILSVALSLLLTIAGIVALAVLTTQSVIKSVIDLMNTLPGEIGDLTLWLETLFAGDEVALNYIHTISQSINDWLTNFMNEQLMPNLQQIIGGVSAGAMSMVTALVNLFIGLIVAIYLLISRGKWRAQLKMVLSSIFRGRGYSAVVEELRFIDRTFTDYISGRILDSIIVGAIVYVFCLIMGIEDAALIAVVNGLTNIIPYFGPYIGGIPSALLILMDDPVKCFWFIVFIVVLQQIDGNIICPKILSDKVGLSSFWVLFSTLLFGGLFGFVGLLIGVPVFVVIYDLLKKLIYRALKKRGKEELIVAYEAKYHPAEKPKKKRLRAKEREE